MRFLDLYMRACGLSECPPVYHRYASLGLVAACLANRVWLEVEKERPLYPNLYIFLLGETAIGKGEAVSKIGYFLKGMEDMVGLIEGSVTSPTLVDLFNSSLGDGGPDVGRRLFFLSDEFANSIGSGEWASSFVKRLTQLFTGDMRHFTLGTRTSGIVTVERPCLNAFLASTPTWLLRSLDPEDITGGFLGRCLTVWPFVRPAPKYRPNYPLDKTALDAEIRARLTRYLGLGGEMHLTQEADVWLEEWYMNRPEEKDEMIRALARRTKALALKLAMCLAVGRDSFVEVGLEDVKEGVQLVEGVKRASLRLIQLIHAREQDHFKEYQVLLRQLSTWGELGWRELLMKVSPYGLRAASVRSLLASLGESGEVVKENRGGKDYFRLGKLESPEDLD